MKPPKIPNGEDESEQEETEIEVVLWSDLTADEKAAITWGITTKP